MSSLIISWPQSTGVTSLSRVQPLSLSLPARLSGTGFRRACQKEPLSSPRAARRDVHEEAATHVPHRAASCRCVWLAACEARRAMLVGQLALTSASATPQAQYRAASARTAAREEPTRYADGSVKRAPCALSKPSHSLAVPARTVLTVEVAGQHQGDSRFIGLVTVRPFDYSNY